MSEKMRRVCFEPAGRLHSVHRTLLDYPPDGYEFVIGDTSWDSLVARAIESDLIYFGFAKQVLRHLVPMSLAKAYVEAFAKRPPRGTSLTYAFGHIVLRKEPWVVEAEWLTHLVGYNLFYFNLLRGQLERALSSRNCKRILCMSEFAKRHFEQVAHSESILTKLSVVYRAAVQRSFVKALREDSTVKLLFVGSANIPGEFEEKGGKEVVDAFTLLQQRYPNVELAIRSDLPRKLKERYSGIRNLRILESIVPRDHLEQEFLTADIFVMAPWHTPPTVYLEAMAYELPVVTVDLFGTGEYVRDGETGLLLQPSSRVAGYFRDWIPDWNSPAYQRAIRAVDQEVVQGLVGKLSVLIGNPDLRRRMGRAGRWEVEHGRYSIARRNEKLKRIFDEAIEQRTVLSPASNGGYFPVQN